MSQLTECTQLDQEHIFIHTLNLIQQQYHSNNIFHGDIKPDNIFFDEKFFMITSDVGSILYLGDQDEESKNPTLF